MIAMIDIGLEKKDCTIVKNAGTIFRSVAAKSWEDRSIILRQVDSIGLKSIKVLTSKGINSITKLRQQDPGYIELVSDNKS